VFSFPLRVGVRATASWLMTAAVLFPQKCGLLISLLDITDVMVFVVIVVGVVVSDRLPAEILFLCNHMSSTLPKKSSKLCVFRGGEPGGEGWSTDVIGRTGLASLYDRRHCFLVFYSYS
jgi:hypothetical protein